ncbi:MAG TPA: Pr6Pr family membrane protein [Candidatus Bathyarchaeia archaeon]|nr:Pr6Pr family membrane protein [Candidatus Bathyarchaeia archaeon]
MQINKSNTQFILAFRIIFTIISWGVLVSMFIVEILGEETFYEGFLSAIGAYKYFTMQTNLIVAIWLTFALAFHKKPHYQEKIKGVFKGAVTLYITITFIVFAIALSWTYYPTGFDAFTNIVIHYVVPIAFIADWFIAEINIYYKWKYLLFWLIYPIFYLIFSIVNGTLTGDYLYPFLDINALGWGKFILFIVLLIIGFLVLGSLLILVNRYRMKKTIEKRTSEIESKDLQ